MFAPGLPSLLFSMRGLAYFQIDVQGPAVDLHSGSYGGAVVNPATTLARIIASFHDSEWRVAVPGFYDRVRAWDENVRGQIRSLPWRVTTDSGMPVCGSSMRRRMTSSTWSMPVSRTSRCQRCVSA